MQELYNIFHNSIEQMTTTVTDKRSHSSKKKPRRETPTSITSDHDNHNIEVPQSLLEYDDRLEMVISPYQQNPYFNYMSFNESHLKTLFESIMNKSFSENDDFFVGALSCMLLLGFNGDGFEDRMEKVKPWLTVPEFIKDIITMCSSQEFKLTIEKSPNQNDLSNRSKDEYCQIVQASIPTLERIFSNVRVAVTVSDLIKKKNDQKLVFIAALICGLAKSRWTQEISLEPSCTFESKYENIIVFESKEMFYRYWRVYWTVKVSKPVFDYFNLDDNEKRRIIKVLGYRYNDNSLLDDSIERIILENELMFD